VTPPGFDPGTFRLVAQRLNHYATPGPPQINKIDTLHKVTFATVNTVLDYIPYIGFT
jgi:hypothetical protein